MFNSILVSQKMFVEYSDLLKSILSLSSCLLAQYPVLLKRDGVLDGNRSGSSIPLLRTVSYSDHNNRPQ